jgi:DNA-binding transcriptional MocR family regulator
MTVYNMKRCMNILGMDNLIEKIKNWVPNYKGITHAFEKPTYYRAITAYFFYQPKFAA